MCSKAWSGGAEWWWIPSEGPRKIRNGKEGAKEEKEKGERRKKEEKGKERGKGEKGKLKVPEVVGGMRRPGGCQHLEEICPEAVRCFGSVARPPRRKISKGLEDRHHPDLALESYKNWCPTGPRQRCEKKIPKRFDHKILEEALVLLKNFLATHFVNMSF